MGTIPTSPQELTADLLSEALRRSGAVSSARVTSFDTHVIGAGAGFMGQLAKVTLHYDKPEAGAPASLIAKFPAAAPENRELAQFFRFYEREVAFYEQIADQVTLRIPHCYFSHFDPETGNYALLLEDLAPAKVGDQLAGCDAATAELCIGNLGTFHATWWDSPKLAALDWMPSLSDEWYVQSVEDGYAKAWPHFAPYFADKVSPELLSVAERFAGHIRRFMTHLGKGPLTMVHADYRLDNLFFPTADGGPELSVIDWQITCKGLGAFDVAYFTGGTMPPAERRAAERGLVELYHRTLTEGGVSAYSLEQCWEDYRLSILFCLVYAVIAIGSLDMANARGVELFDTIAHRTFSGIEDLKAYELLD